MLKALNASLNGDFSLLNEQRSYQYPTQVISGVNFYDEEYKSGNRKLLIRHYFPTEKQRASQLPLFIYIHGGGWCFSYSDQRNFFASTISKNCEVEFVLLNYTLSPEAECGTALNEVHSMYNELINRSSRKRKIFICGDSAGGNLSACLIHLLKSSEKVRLSDGLLLFYPVIDCVNDYPSHKRFASGFELQYDVMRKYIEAYCPDVKM